MTDPLEPSYHPETLREVYPDPDAARRRVAQLRAELAADQRESSRIALAAADRHLEAS